MLFFVAVVPDLPKMVGGGGLYVPRNSTYVDYLGIFPPAALVGKSGRRKFRLSDDVPDICLI